MSAAKSIEIRGDRKSEIIGILAGWAMRIWCKTLCYEVHDHCGVTNPADPLPPVIFALWHNRIFTMPPIWWRTGGKMRKSAVLTSASKDGTILSSAMAVFGLRAVRGSSSRRAVAALIGMKHAIQEGLDICITPDGPRGPRYVFHAGVIKLAESTGAAIVPIHLKFTSTWRLKTWDRLVIPKPFSRVTVIFDELVFVPPRLTPSEFDARREHVEKVLLSGVDDI